ncbi:MAG: membrane protein insertase YidC [Steroidobacteraceae bacterium]
MQNLRLALWMGLLFLVWLNVDQWMRDYAEPVAATATQPAEAPETVRAPPSLSESVPQVAPPSGVPAPATDGVPEQAITLRDAPTVPTTLRVVTDVLDLDVSLVGGDLVRADLLDYPLRKDQPDIKVRLFNNDSPETLYLYQSGLTSGRAGTAEPNHKALFTAAAAEYRLAEGDDILEVPLSWSDGAGLAVTKTYLFRRGRYQVDVIYQVTNSGDAPVSLAPYAQLLRHWAPKETSMFNVETYAFVGPAVFDGNSYQKLDVEDEDESSWSQSVAGGWVASLQHHFVAALPPPSTETYKLSLRVEDRDYLLTAVGPAQIVPAGGQASIDDRLFVGPKLQAQLEQAGPRLELTADYGKLTILAQPLFWLLDQVHGLVGNWGWSIIIVTLLIKLVFYKLAETSGRSMAKMRTVAPRLKAIQERYKEDREGQAKAMMELYKKEKINPVAGCLPMLVQIPFFLAFYWVLLESVEMRQAPFFGWIQDLSSRDPFFVLPLLMGVAMYGQFKLNPAPPDPVQAKVFAFMPVIMTVMFMWFPAGLVLYWLTNTVLSIAQQWKINRLVEAEAKKQRTH